MRKWQGFSLMDERGSEESVCVCDGRGCMCMCVVCVVSVCVWYVCARMISGCMYVCVW